MTDAKRRAAVQALIERYTAEKTATPETARATLINEGIYAVDGQLRPEFGGRQIRSKSAA